MNIKKLTIAALAACVAAAPSQSHAAVPEVSGVTMTQMSD